MNRRIYQYRKCICPFVHRNSNHRSGEEKIVAIETINLFNTINAKVSTAESSPSHNYAGDQGGGEICKLLCHLLLAKRHLDPRFLGTIVHPLTQEEGRLLKKKSGKKIAPRSRCCRRAIFFAIAVHFHFEGGSEPKITHSGSSLEPKKIPHNLGGTVPGLSIRMLTTPR